MASTAQHSSIRNRIGFGRRWLGGAFLIGSAFTLFPGDARAELNPDFTDFIVCNGCSEAQRLSAATSAVPSDGNNWTVVVWDENGSGVNSYAVSREYDRELRREFSYAFAIDNDADAVDTVQLVKQITVNLDAARLPASAGMTWEENGISMGSVPAGILPIPVPPDVPGGPIGSASDLIGNTAAQLAVSNFQAQGTEWIDPTPYRVATIGHHPDQAGDFDYGDLCRWQHHGFQNERRFVFQCGIHRAS